MTRDLLNSVPNAVVGVLVIGVTVLVGLGGRAVVARWMGRHRESTQGSGVSTLVQVASTLFAIVVALVVVSLYTSHSTAEGSVAAEAAALTAALNDARGLSQEQQDTFRPLLGAYVREVQDHGFDALREGKPDDIAARRLDAIYVAVESFGPSHAGDFAAKTSILEQLDKVEAERQSIQQQAGSSVPVDLWFLMLFLGAITLATSWLFVSHSLVFDRVLVVMMSLAIGAGIFSAMILQYPFSGSFAVSAAPLIHGDLGKLP